MDDSIRKTSTFANRATSRVFLIIFYDKDDVLVICFVNDTRCDKIQASLYIEKRR